MPLQEVQPIPLISLDEPSSKETQPWSHDWPLKLAYKTQKYLAYCFTAFLGIHLCSVAVVPALPIPFEIKQQVFEMARSVYQVPIFEAVAVVGSVLVHITSGIVLRFLRPKVSSPVVSERDPRIGLGGITGVVGLGYKKSIISTLIPSLTPLSLSGYILIPLLGYHFYKFRYGPILVDGDSSLVTLEYISVYLQKLVNKLAFVGLLTVGNYHFVSGGLRFNGKYSREWKLFGYFCIIMGTAVGLLGATSIEHLEGFLLKKFTLYLGA